MSKIAIIAITQIQQRQFNQDDSREDLIVSAVRPGYVATDLNIHSGKLTTEQGKLRKFLLNLKQIDLVYVFF
jgi:hypothetical protein